MRDGEALQAGQVSFHNEKLVRKYVVIEKDKDVLKRLEKTLVEKCVGPCQCRYQCRGQPHHQHTLPKPPPTHAP